MTCWPSENGVGPAVGRNTNAIERNLETIGSTAKQNQKQRLANDNNTIDRKRARQLVPAIGGGANERLADH